MYRLISIIVALLLLSSLQVTAKRLANRTGRSLERTTKNLTEYADDLADDQSIDDYRTNNNHHVTENAHENSTDDIQYIDNEIKKLLSINLKIDYLNDKQFVEDFNLINEMEFILKTNLKEEISKIDENLLKKADVMKELLQGKQKMLGRSFSCNDTGRDEAHVNETETIMQVLTNAAQVLIDLLDSILYEGRFMLQESRRQVEETIDDLAESKLNGAFISTADALKDDLNSFTNIIFEGKNKLGEKLKEFLTNLEEQSELIEDEVKEVLGKDKSVVDKKTKDQLEKIKDDWEDLSYELRKDVTGFLKDIVEGMRRIQGVTDHIFVQMKDLSGQAHDFAAKTLEKGFTDLKANMKQLGSTIRITIEDWKKVIEEKVLVEQGLEINNIVEVLRGMIMVQKEYVEKRIAKFMDQLGKLRKDVYKSATFVIKRLTEEKEMFNKKLQDQIKGFQQRVMHEVIESMELLGHLSDVNRLEMSFLLNKTRSGLRNVVTSVNDVMNNEIKRAKDAIKSSLENSKKEMETITEDIKIRINYIENNFSENMHSLRDSSQLEDARKQIYALQHWFRGNMDKIQNTISSMEADMRGQGEVINKQIKTLLIYTNKNLKVALTEVTNYLEEKQPPTTTPEPECSPNRYPPRRYPYGAA